MTIFVDVFPFELTFDSLIIFVDGKLSIHNYIGIINNQNFKVKLKDLRVVEKDFEWIDPLYLFDINKGIVYVNKGNILPNNFKTNDKIVNLTEEQLNQKKKMPKIHFWKLLKNLN